jgi:alpha-glucosidase (family GH31 glycosyl hydrolase)
MRLTHPDLLQAAAFEEDRIIFYRGDIPVLSSAPFQKPLGAVVDGNSLRVDLPGFSITIHPAGPGFDVQFTPAGYIAFKMDGAWFGHGELINQRLPLNRLMLPLTPMETIDNGPTGQSCKLTPAWFSTTGALAVANTPVSVGINQPPAGFPRYPWSFGLFKGPFRHRPFEDYLQQGDGLLTLTGEGLHLSVFCLDNAKEAYRQVVSIFGKPTGIPPQELFRKPTWTTWAHYKTQITQSKVLEFADRIIAQGYPYGVMEIDDRWQTHYGDIVFDPGRFPDPKRMIDELHGKNFKVTAWVVPFFNPGSAAFADGKKRGFLVRRKSGRPYLVRWWQGRGGLLDVTNPAALDWFYQNLRALQEQTGLDGYKFDAGEACFFPKDALSHQPVSPNGFTHQYIDFIASRFGLTEVRSGWLNQPAPIFFRQWDKASTWGTDNGLHSVLTGILALGLTGYPFILPDMVGGNEYEEKADAELMIRWTELNSLLPAMQFSLPPWEYSEECSQICRKYARLHEVYSGRLIQAAGESIQNGDPIIRPVWWGDPTDQEAINCDDQFLVGDGLLVAPVLVKGKRNRDIYLPKGRWKEAWSGEIYEGNRVLEDYPVPLDSLPVFERINQ